VGSIDFATVELWLADRRQAGLGPKMLRECLSVLSLILAFSVKSKALAQNPAAGHEVRVRRRKVREGDGVLTMEQVHQLVAHVRDPYKPAVWLLVFAGLRPAELCGLRVRDVDFVRHAVSVRSTLMPVHGYGDEPWRMVEGPPKTDAGDRTVPIPAWLCDVLPALRAAGLPATIRTYDLRQAMPVSTWGPTPWPWPSAGATATPPSLCVFTATSSRVSRRSSRNSSTRSGKGLPIPPQWARS
jgi:integrase